MNSINFYQGAKILAAGLGTSFVTNYAATKLAKFCNVKKDSYTHTMIKAFSVFTGLAAAALTARHLGVVSFKNLSFLSRTQEAAVVAPVVAATEESAKNAVREVSSYYSAEAHDSPDFLEQMKEENAFVDQLAAQITNKNKA
ncbi:MAG: hypothetical protein KBA81_01555 [Rhabdochlamydiaceae bacterium]|nr:hypothetical protein [Rhabdochlamydiaceae bacterium]